MKILLIPICWFRTVWYSVRYFFTAGVNYIAPISGHDYLETFNDGKKSILKCKVCGSEDIGFY